MSDDEGQNLAAFSDLIAASRSRLFGYIYAMLHNMSDAEDVYQQTTVLLWEKFGEYQPNTNFTSWALKIAYFNIRNFQRSRNRSRVFFSDQVMEKVAASYEEPADGTLAEARTEALIHCLKQLQPNHQRLLHQRYAEGMQLQQLAETERKSTAALSMAIARLRKSLLRCIQTEVQQG